MRILVLLSAVFFIAVACNKIDDPVTDWPETEGELYFPPLSGDSWETISPDSLAWNTDAIPDLLDLLEAGDSRAFLVIKDGKIVIEAYWDKDLLGQQFDQNSTWYWASAGKTLTSFLVGLAQSDGQLDIDDPSSKYLGTGWTSLEAEKEKNITIRHQLTMTTGLDDKGNVFCTDSDCLKYIAAPGTRWAYHNGPYTKLDGVIEGATNETFDDYFNRKLRDPIGMTGFWQYLDYNHVYFSNARSMARFGLMILNNGKWQDNVILDDEEYISESVNTSQDINPSYGYLWWLNGKEKVMYPGFQIKLNQNLTQTAPMDMYAAMGKNGQLINIVPSQNLIVIRMGDNPDISLVPVKFQEDIWEKLDEVINF